MGTVAPLLAGDWYQWRGPEQDGVSRERNLPETWSPDGENVLWSNGVGGMSSPIVMNGRVYTFTRVGDVPAGEEQNPTANPGPKTQEALTCVDADTGKVLWQHLENMTQTDVPFHRLGWSNVAGDPATGRVYGLGAQCMLLCCDGTDGRVIWKRQMTETFGLISTFGGRTPSPALDEDQLFVEGVAFGWGNNGGAQHRIFALDKNTGELNWTAGTGGIPVDAPYNTPVIAVIGGQRLVLFAGGDGGIHAFQARTGKRVWSFKGSKHGMNASVVVHGDRVFASWDLDNYDSTRLGRVVCLNGADVKDGSPREIWRQDGIEAGFPSPTLVDGKLYVLTDNAVLYCMNEETGEIYWKKGYGTIGKASLVYGDGKLYLPEANGRMWVLKLQGNEKPKVLSHVDLEEKLGREYAIFGSVAIANGRIYLQAANRMYCIGSKGARNTGVPPVTPNAETGGTPVLQADSDPIPPPPEEEPADPNAAPAWVQVRPADVALRPREKVTFTARAFDAKGRPLGEVKPDKWAIGLLTMPPPPVRPKELMRANAAVAAQGGTAGPATRPATPEAPKPAAPAAPATQPAKVGNLKGEVDEGGTFTAAAGGFQGGGVDASVGKLTGQARVRVIPPLPWTLDFEKDPVGKPPLTWIGAGMKFAVRELDGNKVLVKLTDIPLYARARTYFGLSGMKDYTVRADVKVTETVYDDAGTIVHKMPDAGIINQRYVFELKGSKQTAGIHAWPAALPRDETQTDPATHKAVPFAWQANAWYRLKLTVRHEDGKAILKGRVWPGGQDEPKDWTVELEDLTPNEEGSPGLWGFSNDHEIYYDNIQVSENP